MCMSLLAIPPVRLAMRLASISLTLTRDLVAPESHPLRLRVSPESHPLQLKASESHSGALYKAPLVRLAVLKTI